MFIKWPTVQPVECVVVRVAEWFQTVFKCCQWALCRSYMMYDLFTAFTFIYIWLNWLRFACHGKWFSSNRRPTNCMVYIHVCVYIWPPDNAVVNNNVGVDPTNWQSVIFAVQFCRHVWPLTKAVAILGVSFPLTFFYFSFSPFPSCLPFPLILPESGLKGSLHTVGAAWPQTHV